MSTHDAQARTETSDYISSHPFDVPCQAEHGIARASIPLRRPIAANEYMSETGRSSGPLVFIHTDLGIECQGEGSHSAQMSLSCLDNTGCNIQAVTIHHPTSCPTSTAVLRHSILFQFFFFFLLFLFLFQTKIR